MVEGPGHDQFLVEPEYSATETQLLSAGLLSLREEEDEGGVVDHHPQTTLHTRRDVAGVVSVVTYDDFPRLYGDGGEGFSWRERQRETRFLLT